MSEHLVQLSVKGGGRARGPDVCPSHDHEEAATGGAPSERLPGRSNGRRYWRSLNDLGETPEFLDFVHREFPRAASEWHDPVSRRNFMKLMGASLKARRRLRLSARPETIRPSKAPEQAQANRTSYYATRLPFEATPGCSVESHQGRPSRDQATRPP
jgi:MoCo/4Fe-4S cofactor protein with predicted Tat translocation signal